MKDNSRRNTRAPYETLPKVTLGNNNQSALREVQKTLSCRAVQKRERF